MKVKTKVVIMTFKEYKDFEEVASDKKYARNVSYYDPSKGWVLDLENKIPDNK